MNLKKQKGFTLIELLIVIAIVAILSVVVILTLNPAELLKQARDSNRISDLSTLKSALALYVSDGKTTMAPSYSICYGDSSDTVPTASTCDGRYTHSGTLTVTTSSSRAIDGSGWLPVNFSSISSGSPISSLPVDPLRTGSTHNFYSYIATSSNLSFEIDTVMESQKYTNATNGVGATDGGDLTNTYEVGSFLNF